MSRPVAANGVSVSNNSWSISDAGAFYVGNSPKGHALKSLPTGVTVTGKCGVVGHSDYRGTYPEGFKGHSPDNRAATWAAAVTCETCIYV